MQNFVFNFNEFLNESAINEGTLMTNKHLGEKAQKEYDEYKFDFLKKQVELCKKHNVKCFLDFGSLLGLYRDGKFVPNDNDTDLGILGETVTKEFLEDVEKEFGMTTPKSIGTLVKKMFKEDKDDDYHQIPYVGIYYLKPNGKKATVKSIKGVTIGVPGDFFFYYPYTESKRITRWPGWEVQLTPDKFFKKLGTIKYNGYSFPIPSSTEEYLEYIYGEDWGTPKSRSGVSQKLELISREEGHSYTYSIKDKKYKK